MAEPAQTPSPRASRGNPKIQFGQMLDVPARGLDGWTVRGMDSTSGRVVVSKRAGDDVDLRSITVEEYAAAQKEVSEAKKKQAPPPPSFGLRQGIFGEGVGVSIQEYDAATNEVLVDGTVDGKPVRRWMPRDEIEKAAREETPENLGKLKEVLSTERPKPKPKKEEEEAEASPETEDEEDLLTDEEEEAEAEAEKPVRAPVQKAVAAPPPTVEEEPKEEPKKGIAEAREALREQREKSAAAPVSEAALENVDEATVAMSKTYGKRAVDVLNAQSARSGEQLERVEQSIEQYSVAKEKLEADLEEFRAEGNTEAVETNQRFLDEYETTLDQFKSESKTLRERIQTNEAQKKALQASLETLTRESRYGNQKEIDAAVSGLVTNIPDNALQELETWNVNLLPGPEKTETRVAEVRANVETLTRMKGEVTAKMPAGTSKTVEVQAEVPAAAGREVEAEITVPGAGAPSIAAAAVITSPQQVLQLAAAASTDLDMKINQGAQTQKNIRAELETIGAQSTRITGQMQEALQRGNEGLAGQLQTELVDLNARRGDLQNRQVQTMTDMSGLRNVKNQIDTLSGNLQAAGENAPPELVKQLGGLIPQGFKMEVEAQAPTAALEEAAAPRSYAAGVPAIPPPPPPSSRAQGLRARLQSRLGIPFQTATAAALAGDGGRTPGGYMEGVGVDAREQELSYQGGAGEQAIPSYTQAPSAGEDEDVYTGAQSGRQRIRKIEQQQRAAKEMLQPTEEVPGLQQLEEAFPEPGEGPSPFAEEPGQALRDTGRRAREAARAAGLAGQRATSEAAYQRKLAALRGKHGALTGSIGGSESNIEGLRRIKRFYDMVKAGTAITFVGLIITIAMMNASLINKYLIKSKYIPNQSFIEDLLTAWIDFNLLLFASLPFLIPLTIIAAVLGGAVAGIGGIASAISGVFN